MAFSFRFVSFLFRFYFASLLLQRFQSSCLRVCDDGRSGLLVAVVVDDSFRRLRFTIVVLLVPCRLRQMPVTLSPISELFQLLCKWPTEAIATDRVAKPQQAACGTVFESNSCINSD